MTKSRHRDPKALGFGGYMLMDALVNLPVVGSTRFDATLDDVEKYLASDDALIGR